MVNIVTQPTTRYTQTAIVFHWIIAVFVIFNVFLAWSFDYWPEKNVQIGNDLHKSIGITVFGLALMRILWRWSHQPPALAAYLKPWEARTAKIAHIVLYVLIVIMPVSGWLYDSAWKDGAAHPIHFFGLFDFPRLSFIVNQPANIKKQYDAFFGVMHTKLAYVIYAFVSLHVAGALKHQFMDKKPELQRMSLKG